MGSPFSLSTGVESTEQESSDSDRTLDDPSPPAPETQEGSPASHFAHRSHSDPSCHPGPTRTPRGVHVHVVGPTGKGLPVHPRGVLDGEDA